MKILIGMPAKDSWGGPIYCEPPFVEALRRIGVEVDEETYAYGTGAVNPTVFQRIRRVLDAAFRLRRRLQAANYEVVHLNTSIDKRSVMRDLTTLHLIKRYKVPIHLKMHGSDAAFLRTSSWIWQKLIGKVFKLASDIGVLSREEKDNFINAGCPVHKLSEALYTGNVGEFRSDPDFRANHKIGPSTKVLLFSARFIPAKGLLDTIRATAMILGQGSDVVLYCLGDGPQRVKAEELVSELGVSDKVIFTGYISEADTAEFHANADIFVLPTSHDEGFPLVLLKSLAAGSPIITTKIRAAADHFIEPKNCLFVQPKDPVDIAEKLLRLLKDEELSTSMSDNNRSLFEQFTPPKVAEHYLKIYQSIISRK